MFFHLSSQLGQRSGVKPTWVAPCGSFPAGASAGEDDGSDELPPAQFHAVVPRRHQPAHDIRLPTAAHANDTHRGHGNSQSPQHLALCPEGEWTSGAGLGQRSSDLPVRCSVLLVVVNHVWFFFFFFFSLGQWTQPFIVLLSSSFINLCFQPPNPSPAFCSHTHTHSNTHTRHLDWWQWRTWSYFFVLVILEEYVYSSAAFL